MKKSIVSGCGCAAVDGPGRLRKEKWQRSRGREGLSGSGKFGTPRLSENSVV